MKSQKWKSIQIDTSSIPPSELEFLGGIEELEDYEILRPGSEAKKSKKRKTKVKDGKKKKKLKTEHTGDTENVAPEEPEDDKEEIDMSAWSNCYFHGSILNGLKDLGFQTPTKIQELTIPAAVRGNQDILGAAETGSGKTLAFGIPILNGILAIKESKKQKNPSNNSRPLYCLILTPTRELAIQIKRHLIAVAKHTDIKISSVVGGMAPEKQRRILKKGPEIIVATPGRLWEMIEEGEEHLSEISKVRYLVIDEADRMVEKGHFAELTQILNLANGPDMNKRRQTFVFSATLTMIHDAPKRLAMKRKSKMQQKQKIESLVGLTGMKNPKVIDITKKSAVAESLTETQIMCSNEEKDSYLYYFLLMHPGRTLVFCNSIDCVRRLRSVLELLNCHPLPLHASMHQRQRLKNLDKFEESKKCVLLATDVAARGLDIKGIEHVIHFQVPRTAETYVHRSGRTARAQNEGLSLMLVEPKEACYYRNICKTLNKEKTLPTFPVDHKVFMSVKERVTLSRLIDKTEHRVKRLNAENRWFENTAKEMDIEIEDENLLNDMGDPHEKAAKSKKINLMKKQLKLMLSGKLSSSSFHSEKAVEVAKKIKSKKKRM